MSVKNLLFPALLATLTFAACTTAHKMPVAAVDTDLQRLATWMTGDFSSQAQSERDTNYFDIRLHIHPIWPNDKNNLWFYVEQAAAATPDKPYRQRVYQLQRLDSVTLTSKVYTLPDPANYTGAYQHTTSFDQLQPAMLSLRDGCTVYLNKRNDGSFGGGTRGKGCESTLKGASYAVSLVVVKEKMLRSWDRGFDEKGEQVWGAVNAGYDFIKQ